MPLWSGFCFSRLNADNHLIELAVAGAAKLIVANNVRDFGNPQLRFPPIKVVAPDRFASELP